MIKLKLFNGLGFFITVNRFLHLLFVRRSLNLHFIRKTIKKLRKLFMNYSKI